MSQFRDSQSGDSKSDSVGHQPPNQADLKRYPPVGAVCTAVRGWLRDFVDHDLDERVRSEVEEHVHRCRSCSLALARAEHEVLVLRDAFADERTRAGQARPRLIAQIVDAVRRDEIDESESRRRRRARRTLRPAGVAASVIAVVGISFGLALSGRWMAKQAPSEPKFVVVDVAGASFRALGAAGGFTDLELGSEFGGGVAIQTRTDGELEFVALADGTASGTVGSNGVGSGGVDLGGPGSGAAGGARFFLGGGTDLQSLPDAGWELRSGELHVDTEGPVSVRLGEDGALGRVEFDAGAEAWLSIEDVRRPDRLAVGAVTPTEPRSRVEVLRSVGAGRLFRGSSLRSDPVGADALMAGRTVEWLPGGPLEETFASTSAVVAASLAARDPGVATVLSTNGPNDSTVVLTGPDGRPAADVLVSIETASGRVEVRSDSEGMVSSKLGSSGLGGSGLGQRALVSVSTRPGQGLASTSPRLLQDGDVTKGPLRIELASDRPVSGRLLDVDGAPMARAVVVPLLVDELFQRVARLEKLAVSSGADGVFRLEGLPADFEPFQTLAVEILPLERQDRAVPFVAPIGRDRFDLQTLRRPASRELRVEGLQPGSVVRVLESIPGLPAEVLAVRHDLVVRSDGGATFRSCGLGALFAVDAESRFDDGSLPLEPLAVEGRLLVAAADSVAGAEKGTSGASDEEAPEAGASSRALNSGGRSWLAAVDLVSGGGSQLLFRPGRRSGALYSPPELDTALAPVLIEEPASLVGSGQIHLERADGRLEVVGRTGFIGLQIERPTLLPYRLTGVWSDGSIARASIESREQSLQLAVVRPGSIRLVDGATDASPIADFDQGRTGSASLRFLCLDGAVAGCEFFRSAKVGGEIVMPAGRYRASIGDLDLGELRVESGVEVRLPIVR